MVPPPPSIVADGGLSSIDNLPTKNEAARSGARAANFFRFIHKMKPCPKAAKIQMGRDILTFPKHFTAADLEKAIEDSPFVQRLAERADQDPSSLLVGQKEFLDMWLGTICKISRTGFTMPSRYSSTSMMNDYST